MKNKILQIKFMLSLLFFLIIAASVSANEVIKLNQFNNYLKQARNLNTSNKPQEALKVLQQAKEKINTTLLAKVFKNKEIKQTEKEIEKMKQLVDEKTKKAIIENLPTPFSTPTQTPIPIQSEPLTFVLTPTLTPTPIPEDKPSYVYDPYYPIILSLSDNKGGQNKYSQYNQYRYGSSITGITLKIGDRIRWDAEASDPKGRQIFYNFEANSQRFMDVFGRGQYKTENWFEYTITEEDLKDAGETLYIGINIRSEKDNYRTGSSGRDDWTGLSYKLQPN